jgi:hypothetical protein
VKKLKYHTRKYSLSAIKNNKEATTGHEANRKQRVDHKRQ